MKWLLLILSLPTENTAARMRVWRALKACGAAVLRDGVYVLPLSSEHEKTLNGIVDDLRQNAGTAHLLRTEVDDRHFPSLFDRSAEFGSLLPAPYFKKYGKRPSIVAFVDGVLQLVPDGESMNQCIDVIPLHQVVGSRVRWKNYPVFQRVYTNGHAQHACK